MKDERKICVGMIAGAHGVRGLVRLRSFTEDPEAIADYMPLTDEDGKREFKIELRNTVKDYFVASLDGLKNKEEADAMRGVKLFALRSKMPKAGKKAYYDADLIGLVALDAAGKSYGKVMGVHNHGAGPFLEIGNNRRDSFMLPFTDACVPEVDLKAGKVLVVVPEGWLKDEKPDPAEVQDDE